MATKRKLKKEILSCIGKLKGSNGNKYNRAFKLLHQREELTEKFHGLAKRGGYETEHAQSAIAVMILMQTGMRIGNESSAEGYHTKPHPNEKDNVSKFVQTYGLTTCLNKHVKVNLKNNTVEFNFVGKKSVGNYYIIEDKQLTWAIWNLQQSKLREVSPINRLLDVDCVQMTKFIKRYVGRVYSPKDFRTMVANVIASDIIIDSSPPSNKKQWRELVRDTCTTVSEHLNNTPSVCRKNYINSALFDYIQPTI